MHVDMFQKTEVGPTITRWRSNHAQLGSLRMKVYIWGDGCTPPTILKKKMSLGSPHSESFALFHLPCPVAGQLTQHTAGVQSLSRGVCFSPPQAKQRPLQKLKKVYNGRDGGVERTLFFSTHL